jgi:hypothetical protein
MQAGARAEVVPFVWRRTLRMQRAPFPTPTTETRHFTRESMAPTQTTIARAAWTSAR